jgi:hypothetical protein
MKNTIGKIAFVVGIVVAIIGGIWGGKAQITNDFLVAVLLIAGVLIGLLNITASEATATLAAAVALIILGIWGDTSSFAPVLHLSQGLGENIQGVVGAFALLMAPVAFIVAIKAVLAAGKPGD